MIGNAAKSHGEHPRLTLFRFPFPPKRYLVSARRRGLAFLAAKIVQGKALRGLRCADVAMTLAAKTSLLQVHYC